MCVCVCVCVLCVCASKVSFVLPTEHPRKGIFLVIVEDVSNDQEI